MVSWYREAVPDTVFVYGEQRQFRVLSIGNCQSEHHAQLARMALDGCSADYLLVHKVNNAERIAQVEAYLDLPTTRYDLILAFDLQEKWGPVSRLALEERYGRDRIFYIPNLTFEGLFPDMVSLSPLKVQIQAPMGNYHSRIAVGSWLAGLDAAAALKLYSSEHFEKLGYFAQFSDALDEYRRREVSADYSFGDTMVDHMRDHVGYFSRNHPTPAMLALFMRDLRDMLVERGMARSSGVKMVADLVMKSLIEFGAAPVFPEIAEAAGLRHGGERSFLIPRLGGGYPISLEEFVTRSFKAYDERGRDGMLEPAQSAACLSLVQGIL